MTSIDVRLAHALVKLSARCPAVHLQMWVSPASAIQLEASVEVALYLPEAAIVSNCGEKAQMLGAQSSFQDLDVLLSVEGKKVGSSVEMWTFDSQLPAPLYLLV